MMSKYTTQVRWLVEHYTPDMKDSRITDRIANAAPLIFDFDYPIWNPEYKNVLETKIIKHYFNKEIGMETVGLWKLYLDEKMNLIMPYYNQLYLTTVKDYDWLTDTNITEDYTGNATKNEKGQAIGEANTENTLNGTNKETGTNTFTANDKNVAEGSSHTDNSALGSDLPQANYAGIDYGTNLTEGNENVTTNNTDTITQSHNDSRDMSYVQNQTAQSDTHTQNTNTVDTVSDDTYQKVRKGASGANSLTDLLVKYRDSLLNIDKMIIDELQDLFMMIY